MAQASLEQLRKVFESAAFDRRKDFGGARPSEFRALMWQVKALDDLAVSTRDMGAVLENLLSGVTRV
jgi:hypothetical protein